MPRGKGKSTKACQTDTVFLTEEQVENILAKSVSHLENEIKRLQTEVSDLKSTSNKLINDSDALNNLQQASETQAEQFRERFDSFEEENNAAIQSICKQFNSQMEARAEIINRTMVKTDELEQIHKMNNLRIAGLDEEDGEDIESKVINLAQKMKLKLKSTDIEEARRMGPVKENKKRDVLVKFTCSAMRDNVYRHRKLLTSSAKSVYVNEDLTQRRSLLFYEARRLRKQGRIFGVWSQHGSIMIKVNQQSKPEAVSNYGEVVALMKKESGVTQETRNFEEEANSLSEVYNDLGELDYA